MHETHVFPSSSWNSYVLSRARPLSPGYWGKIMSSPSVQWSLSQENPAWEGVLISCSVFSQSLIGNAWKPSLIFKHISLLVPIPNLGHSRGSLQNVGFLQMVDVCHPQKPLFRLHIKSGAEMSLLEKIHSYRPECLVCNAVEMQCLLPGCWQPHINVS